MYRRDAKSSALGIRAVDDLTLEVETEGVFPPLPGVMKFAFTLQESFEAHGPYYNNDPDTSVSAGPYVLTEFDPGNRIVVEAPKLQRVSSSSFAADRRYLHVSCNLLHCFPTGEVDTVPYERLTQLISK